ncbi:MAG: hypothetical protein FJ148_15340 [Deltaproteobacteria bacterium]|nr:hypothetical protein [Deltaproteobacteria bacterium]
MTFEELTRYGNAELDEVHRAGRAPLLADLAGREYCGWNRPAHFSLIGIRKFVKGFFVPEQTDPERADEIEGFNIPAIQNGLDGEWLAKHDDDRPKRFGFYITRPLRPGERGGRFENSLLLDYAASRRNATLDPSRFIRDFVVQVRPGDDRLLLGKAMLALAPGRLVFSNFFLLRLRRRHDWRG